jgi:hypothetical protein
MKRQLAFILARTQVPYHWLQHPTTDDDGDETLEELPEDLQEILFNSRLSTHFKLFGKELGVLDPKSLEDVYKSHLETSRMSNVIPSSMTYSFLYQAHRLQVLTRHGEIWLAPSSTLSSMQGSEMTSSWLRRKRVTVGFIRIKITVRDPFI